MLYQQDNFRQIELHYFLEQIINKIQQSYHRLQNITIEQQFPKIKTDAKLGFYIGLIINELVNNAYKYAFQAHKKGSIKIELTYNTSIINLEVKDNGLGIDRQILTQEKLSFGFNLIRTLCQQYQGDFSLQNNNGLEAKVVLNIPQ
jgi:two-component sensor histidine kinase